MVSRFGWFRNAFSSESRIKTASTENTDKAESEGTGKARGRENGKTGKRRF